MNINGDLRDIEIIIPDENENTFLNNMDNLYVAESQMTAHEREYINALVLRNKPKKLLEIGVSAGSSSIVILNAIKSYDNAMLHSVDYKENWYKSPDKKTGYLIDNYTSLKNKWKLYTGGLSINFLESIGAGIDFCLIDTVHTNPGAILDYLMILPYLTDDAIVLVHDIGWYTYDYPENVLHIANSILLSTIKGIKLIQGNYDKEDENRGRRTYISNIGGVKLSSESKNSIYDIINLLTIKWETILTEKEEQEIIEVFKKHYNEYYVNKIIDIFKYQRNYF